MPIKAVIFDIYKTILRVDPPPPDAEYRWKQLGEETWNRPPSLSLAGLEAAARLIIDREHRAARNAGIPHPEIFWPSIVAEVLPELSGMPTAEIDHFLYVHAQLVRVVSLAPGAAEVLRELSSRNLLIGIASNSQPYTVHELAKALGSAAISSNIFHPKLCFWSFEAGFAKPDPHVYRWLTARLGESGVAAGETLMVGDRVDNDMEPAEAQCWQTWLLGPAQESRTRSGDWFALREFLRSTIG